MEPEIVDYEYLRRVRNFLGLRRIDCYLGTGVPIHRISEAESGRRPLDPAQHKAIVTFLRNRWAAVMGTNVEVQKNNEPLVLMGQR